MFDDSFLPAAQYQFVVVADTHYMLDPKEQRVEFASRRQQTARTAHALRLIAKLQPPLIIHMGDLVQEFPERPNFAHAMDEASTQLAQLAKEGVETRLVAGNHDIGDKPDPTMPASWVTPAFLADYHRRFGPSWYSWNVDNLHFVVLNSQIMNSSLPEASAQQAWLEEDLEAHHTQRILLFLHLPPFLFDVQEAALGHYDNLGEPTRSWLLGLVNRYAVELLFAAHVHYAFYQHFGQTHYHTVPSVAFTRPGFSELFASPAPPEQGRDDCGKLGFFLVRVHEAGMRVHLIRTAGSMGEAECATGTQCLLTRLSPDLPHSPLGVVLHHPLAAITEVPSVWPSAIRQPVRNDYPLLACGELGVRHLRIPARDLQNPLQMARLQLLRVQGATLTAQWLWSPDLALSQTLPAHAGQIDGVELVLLGGNTLDAPVAEQIDQWRGQHGFSITLSTLLPGQMVTGKQHGRAQRGFRWDTVSSLDQTLDKAGVTLERICCRLIPEEGIWQTMTQARHLLPLKQIRNLDWVVELPPPGAEQGAESVAAEALFTAALWPGSRLYFEPLIDLDRTMDVTHGLLDRLCNPRPVFHLLRTLNTLLFYKTASWRALPRETGDEVQILGLENSEQRLWLVMPSQKSALISLKFLRPADSHAGMENQIYDLIAGTSRELASKEESIEVSQPLLVLQRPSSLTHQD